MHKPRDIADALPLPELICVNPYPELTLDKVSKSAIVVTRVSEQTINSILKELGYNGCFNQYGFILTDINHYYLQQLGIDVWVERDKPSLSPTNALADLASQVAACTQCSLHCNRTQTVFARGNALARLMVIGEAPGFHEDQQGLPFVGKAGGLLNNMLQSIGLGEDDVYIANVLKCRPPDNRDPTPEEVTLCSNYLSQQIQLVQPALILALGRFAGQFLLKNNLAMNQMRNKQHEYNSIPCFVSYHPAYLLRKPSEKKRAFSDLLQVQKVLSLSV